MGAFACSRHLRIRHLSEMHVTRTCKLRGLKTDSAADSFCESRITLLLREQNTFRKGLIDHGLTVAIMTTRLVHPFLRYLLFAAAIFCLLPHLFSQEITHATPATNEQLDAWLHSSDPRLVAWAGTLARERKNADFISLLPDWIKQSPLIRDYGYSPNREDNRVYDAVLDAMIRGGSQSVVEPNVLSELGSTYPIQAFLLLDRLPADQQLAVLKEWFAVAGLSKQSSVLAHLAAMRLAQWPTPVPGFAARIVAAAEEQFTVDLVATAAEASVIGFGACGDSFFKPPASGWPVVYFPAAEESQNSTTNATLIALDSDRMSYRWVEENSPGGSCNGLRGLDQSTRHEIVAHWLGQSQNTMNWQERKTVTVRWTNRAAFDSALSRLLEKEQVGFASTTEHLVQSGLLSKEESAWVRPKLIVRIVCHIEPCPIRGAAKEQAPQMWSPFF
jgi:hypothetical protein